MLLYAQLITDFGIGEESAHTNAASASLIHVRNGQLDGKVAWTGRPLQETTPTHPA